MPARRARIRSGSERTLPRTRPISAGAMVSAATMVIATTRAAARPSAPTNETPEMYRPRMEITTVLPATTTAAPEVLSAATAEVTTSMPASSCSRCRETRNRP